MNRFLNFISFQFSFVILVSQFFINFIIIRLNYRIHKIFWSFCRLLFFIFFKSFFF
jgi:hypothetical protein